MCAHTYSNKESFDKVITKIKWCSLFAIQCILRYYAVSLYCSFVDCGVRVSVSFIFCIFLFPVYVKRAKISTRSSAPWLSGSVFTLRCIGRRFAPGYDYVLYVFKVFFHTVFCILGSGLVLGLRLVLGLESDIQHNGN